MSVKEVVPGVWQVPIHYVNAFILEDDDGLTLIDSGMPGGDATVLDALRSIGRGPADVVRILVTHSHSDHSGGLAGLKRATSAPAYMHAIDAELVREGRTLRPLSPSPGLINRLVCRFLLPDAPTEVEPAAIEHEVADGETLSNGLVAIHVPGHCAGQLAFLSTRHGGVLIAADACANAFGLALSPMYEDHEAGRRSLERLAALDFDVAVFGHGRPILSGASRAFARKWPPA